MQVKELATAQDKAPATELAMVQVKVPAMAQVKELASTLDKAPATELAMVLVKVQDKALLDTV